MEAPARRHRRRKLGAPRCRGATEISAAGPGPAGARRGARAPRDCARCDRAARPRPPRHPRARRRGGAFLLLGGGAIGAAIPAQSHVLQTACRDAAECWVGAGFTTLAFLAAVLCAVAIARRLDGGAGRSPAPAVAIARWLRTNTCAWSAFERLLGALRFAILFAAAFVSLALAFDPRYRDFPLAAFATPAAGYALLAWVSDPVARAASAGREERVLAAVLRALRSGDRLARNARERRCARVDGAMPAARRERGLAGHGRAQGRAHRAGTRTHPPRPRIARGLRPRDRRRRAPHPSDASRSRGRPRRRPRRRAHGSQTRQSPQRAARTTTAHPLRHRGAPAPPARPPRSAAASRPPRRLRPRPQRRPGLSSMDVVGVRH